MHNFLIIPAYKPNNRLLTLIKLLEKANNLKILVVNNGNTQKYNEIFDKIGGFANTDVVFVKENIGKGHGIKSGLNFLKKNYVHINCCIFADADGQHTNQDIIKILNFCENNILKNTFILGTRDHNFQTPKLNRIGNYLYNIILNLKYGTKIKDSLSGLRAINFDDIDILLKIKDNDFRFEVATIKEFIKLKFKIREIKVSSTYFVDKKSHFSKLSDSIKLLKYVLMN